MSPPPHHTSFAQPFSSTEAKSPSRFRKKGVCSGEQFLLQRSCFVSARNKKKANKAAVCSKPIHFRRVCGFPQRQHRAASVCHLAGCSFFCQPTQGRTAKNSRNAPQGLGLSCLCIHKHTASNGWTRNREAGKRNVYKPRQMDSAEIFMTLGPDSPTRHTPGLIVMVGGPENSPRIGEKETFPLPLLTVAGATFQRTCSYS